MPTRLRKFLTIFRGEIDNCEFDEMIAAKSSLPDHMISSTVYTDVRVVWHVTFS